MASPLKWRHGTKRGSTVKAKKTKKAEKTGDKTMLIEGINPKTWQSFKIRAAKEGRQIKWLFHSFIETYASGK